MKNAFWTWVMKTGDKLTCGYYETKERINTALLKFNLRLRHATLTPRGECAYRYYQSIVDGRWQDKDYIEAYESSLNETISQLKAEGYELSREQAAEDMCRIFSMMKKAA